MGAGETVAMRPMLPALRGRREFLLVLRGRRGFLTLLIAMWVFSSCAGKKRCDAFGRVAFSDLLRLAVEVGGGVVRATRIIVLSRFGKFLLKDVFGVRCCEDLQDLECISECRGVGVKAKVPLAAGHVAAPTPAFPEEDQRNKGSEEPETECDARVDQDGTSIARRERCAKRQGDPSGARLTRTGTMGSFGVS